jgi:hypothetical protein
MARFTFWLTLLTFLLAPPAVFYLGFLYEAPLTQGAGHTLLSCSLFSLLEILPRVCHGKPNDEQWRAENQGRTVFMGILILLTAVAGFLYFYLHKQGNTHELVQEGLFALIVNNSITLLMMLGLYQLKASGKASECLVETPTRPKTKKAYRDRHRGQCPDYHEHGGEDSSNGSDDMSDSVGLLVRDHV